MLIIYILAWLLIFYILIGVGLGSWAAIAGYRAFRNPALDPSLGAAWAKRHDEGFEHLHIVSDLIVVSAYKWPAVFLKKT